MTQKSLKLSNRSDISPFFAMEVMRQANERQAAGEDILHLEVGEPYFGAPSRVINSATQLLEQGSLGYTEALGTPNFRQAIARHYKAVHNATISPENVVATFGASGAFLIAFLVLFDVGDRVAIVEPCYPAYRNILQALGVEVVSIRPGPGNDFSTVLRLLQKTPSIRGLVIASPANPTGTMLTADELFQLVGWCKTQHVRLISDEIYHGIHYERVPSTAANMGDHTIVINSFSKYFAMTGWRIGWMVAPTTLVPTIEKIAQNFFVSPSALSQHAAIVALDCRDELDLYVKAYHRNRSVLLETLPGVGFTNIIPAHGAFYLYADASNLTNDTAKLCKKILEDIGVAITPGVDFDPTDGHRYVRVSFAGKEQMIVQAAHRLANWKH
jgi:aspartate/methionine/tyrosine aminotransferase